MRWSVLPALLVMACASFVRADQATSEELHRLIDEGKYPEALQKISAGLGLKGAAAKTVNRYELFMLKGDCHLRLRALPQASKAYADASEEATDDRQRAVTAAHRALLKAAKAFTYVPKPSADKSRPAPIDIIDPVNRKAAFAAMLSDEIAANDAKLKAAKGARTLPPIADAVAPLTLMEGLELAATDDSARVTAIRSGLIEQSKKVVADALRDLDTRLGQIDKQANTFIEFYREVYETAPNGLTRVRKEKAFKKRGPSEDQVKELSDMTATCDRVNAALPEMAQKLAAEQKAFDPFMEDASRLRKEVARIMDTDYQRIYKELPKK